MTRKNPKNHVPKNRLAAWYDHKSNTYYERDLRTGKMIYVRKFVGEKYGSTN